MENKIDINGEIYVLDLEKIMDFIDFSSKKDYKERELTDVYDRNDENNEFSLASKAVREITTQRDSQIDNLRYDFVKTLITFVITSNYDNSDEAPMGYKIALQTLINNNFLKKL